MVENPFDRRSIPRISPKGSDPFNTPPEAIEALLNVEEFPGGVWEPACGCGNISKVLIAHRYPVTSTDLYDYGYGVPGIDFLRTTKRLRSSIVTNPPYSLTREFMEHAMDLRIKKLALLMRLQYLEGGWRARFYQSSHLTRVWVFSYRIGFAIKGADVPVRKMIAYAWYIWERGYQGLPTLGWLTRENNQ
jgi:hypothetical protein